MSMDFMASRRGAATYGKGSKKVLVHDLFEHRNSPQTSTETISNSKSWPHTHDTSTDPRGEVRNQGEPELLEHTPPSTSSAQANVLRNTLALDETTKPNKKLDLFEIDSSDDGAKEENTEHRSAKKRRVTRPLRRENGEELGRASEVSNILTGSTTLHNKPKKGKSHGRPHETAKSVLLKTELEKTVSVDPQIPLHGAKVGGFKPARPHDPARKRAPSKLQQKRYTESTAVEEDVSTDASGHLTDHSTLSITSASSTPKRKRPLTPHSDASAASPSSIGFTSLRLTPEGRSTAKKTVSPGLTSDEDETPRRVRSRLRDRLDAPEISSNVAGHEILQTKTSHPSHVTLASSDPQDVDLKNHANLPHSESSANPATDPPSRSQTKVTYGNKARTTYAKERSHLSDMTDGLDALTNPQNSQSSQNFFSQPQQSNLELEMQLENDDDDDQGGVTKLKSIHELRRAGVNSRFDRELQALMEDIETDGPATKSLRIQAFMKLIRRMNDTEFTQHLMDGNRIHRLTSRASTELDVLSSTLLVICFCCLIAEDTAPSILLSIFESVVKVAPELIRTDKSLAQLSSDRKQNLSKSLIKDIVRFEGVIIEQKLLVNYANEKLFGNEITLQCLDVTLRGALGHSEITLKMTKQCYNELLNLLKRISGNLQVGLDASQNLCLIQKAAKLLESFAIAFDESVIGITDSRFEELGQALAEIMAVTRRKGQEINQCILRAIVSLSNNKPRMCHMLGKTAVINSIFQVIDDHFLAVATEADNEQKVDQGKLDSVILALGCLLNLAECDTESRLRLSTTNATGQTCLEKLVAMFNSQVSKVQEAVTQEQSQVLVAFGYLSMLLCTLALDKQARQQIIHSLASQSFQELCVAAETFFNHLRTLEHLSSDDASMSAFTARFYTILETVRLAVD